MLPLYSLLSCWVVVVVARLDRDANVLLRQLPGGVQMALEVWLT